jgi:hypothetical protein
MARGRCSRRSLVKEQSKEVANLKKLPESFALRISGDLVV